MSQSTQHLYEFGPFRLDVRERLLQRDGATISLTPKAFDLLLALVERHGRLVEKEELLRLVWPDAFVEEANLTYNISFIRKALGDGENGRKLIETVPKRGYRFAALVREISRGANGANKDAPAATGPDVLSDRSQWRRELESDGRLKGRLAEVEPPVGERRHELPPEGHITKAPRAAAAMQNGVAARPVSSGKIILDTLKCHWLGVALVFAALVLVGVATFFYFNHKPPLTDKDTILLTDFTNTTGDVVFDGTLKQALAVHLGQSPFLNLFADERVRETLKRMNRSPDERVTLVIGREICQRQGLKVLLTGSIASLGRNYVINLEAVNGQTGDVLAREQGEAEGKEQVLRTLGEAASRLREKLGESLSSIQKFDVRLEHATTSSLEAFKAFSLGFEQNSKGQYFEAISSYHHALELDPNFALAYGVLAATYGNTGQAGLAAVTVQKAFELRERVAERERLHITWLYYWYATGESNKIIEVLELLKQTYPRDFLARHSLGVAYLINGQYENALEELREAIRLNQNSSLALTSVLLARTFIKLNRFAEAKAIGEQLLAQKHHSLDIHSTLYNLAFVQGDTAAMQQHVEWASGQPGAYAHLSWQAGATGFAGQWQQTRGLSTRADELAQQRKLKEVAGDIVSANAERAAVLGQCQQSRAELARAAVLPRSTLSYFRASMAQALCGNATQAQALNDEAIKRYPKNTIVNEVNLPLIRAALELQRGNRTQAIQILTAASRYENVSNFYQNYLRGRAYLGERNSEAAAREFQTILDHRGWSPTSPLYPLAHLGLARAAMLQNDTAKARKSYQDFLASWKDADADLPALIEAKQEYERLK